METAQMIERLLARMDASQAKADANTTEMKEMYAIMKSNQEQILAKIEANGKAHREATYN
jgi:hypothetical protein